MPDEFGKSRLREWLVGIFIKAINNISVEADRADVVGWLAKCRDVVATDKTFKEKFLELYALIDSRKTAQVVMNSVVVSVKNYKNSDLPLAVKICVPVTLLAVPFIGGQGAGIAALGGAFGVPALLLIFLGSAGLTAIIEPFVNNKEARSSLSIVVEHIRPGRGAKAGQCRPEKGDAGGPREPERAPMPDDEMAIREQLLVMEPYAFERHVMSFFETDGIETSWVTQKSNDMGVDGFAKRRDGGVIVVQCKRYATDNPVGRPDVQKFKSVIQEQGADSGYIVTTSRFTAEARENAKMLEGLTLVDMDELVRWHRMAPNFTKINAQAMAD